MAGWRAQGDLLVRRQAAGGREKAAGDSHSGAVRFEQLDEYKIMGCAGDAGDRTHFAEFVAKNLKLYELRNDTALTTAEAAAWTRKALADALRRKPWQVNTLIGGYDEVDGASLYFMDYLAAMAKVPFGAHGYGAYFTYGLMDRMWRPNMSEDEILAILDACIAELQTRFMVSMPAFFVKKVDASGVTVLRSINSFDDERARVGDDEAAAASTN